MATGLTFRATDVWLGFPVDGGLERAAAGRLVLDRGRTLSRHRRIPSLQLSPVVSGIRGLHGTRTGSGLYLKWSAGSGSGPNLLLRVPSNLTQVIRMNDKNRK